MAAGDSAPPTILAAVMAITATTTTVQVTAPYLTALAAVGVSVPNFCATFAAEARVAIVYPGGTLQQSGITYSTSGSFDITFSI